MIRYIDTHIHLDLLDDPESRLEEARQAGIGAWVVPGISSARWPALMATAERYASVYAAPGIHPQAAGQGREADFSELQRLLEHPGVVALGEVGLDRRVACPWQIQEQVFVRMIRLARQAGKPLLIHARGGTQRLLELMVQEGADRVGGIFHAFSGSLETARTVIDMGFAIGIGGVVTLPTARRLPHIVRELPEDAVVLETDAPDMTPAPWQGQPNRPVHLTLVAERVAALRGWSLEETARITTANAIRVLKLPMTAMPASNRRLLAALSAGLPS